MQSPWGETDVETHPRDDETAKPDGRKPPGPPTPHPWRMGHRVQDAFCQPQWRVQRGVWPLLRWTRCFYQQRRPVAANDEGAAFRYFRRRRRVRGFRWDEVTPRNLGDTHAHQVNRFTSSQLPARSTRGSHSCHSFRALDLQLVPRSWALPVGAPGTWPSPRAILQQCPLPHGGAGLVGSRPSRVNARRRSSSWRSRCRS